MATILVTGGAGYIGSHTTADLVASGHDVVVYDDLSSGHPEALPEGPGPPGPAGKVTLVVAPVQDAAAVEEVFERYRPAAVVHFAGAIEPNLSMTDPRRFWHSNVRGSLALADACIQFGGVPLVFSSSCSVYGTPEHLPVGEAEPLAPESVYAETKLATEQMLRAYDRAYGLRSVSLRYFNACGAAASGDNGADHRHKVHLMTVACLTAMGQRPHVEVFGDDYPTPDGTCLRDYIHVEDLASAHRLAVEALLGGAGSTVYNLGVGRPFSVLEVLDTVERVTESPVPRVISPRRLGDPAAIYADNTKIRAELGWQAAHPDLDDMVASAWQWHTRHPGGFTAAPS